MWNLDGPKFVRFASRLMYYSGAVTGKIKVDYAEGADADGNPVKRDENVESTTKMKMSEAMGQVAQDDLSSLNYESQSAGWGDLFDRVSVPAVAE